MRGIWGKVSQFWVISERTDIFPPLCGPIKNPRRKKTQNKADAHYSSYDRSNYHVTPSLELPITHKWKAYKTLDLIPRIISWYHPLLFATVFDYFAFKTHWKSSIFALTRCKLCLESASGELLFSLQNWAQVSSALWNYTYFLRPFQPEGFFFFSHPSYESSSHLSLFWHHLKHGPTEWSPTLHLGGPGGPMLVCEVWGGLESPRLARATRMRSVLPRGLRKADIYKRAQTLFDILSTYVVIPVPTS